MYSDTSLQEMAKYNPSAELAIVLGERLEEVQAEFGERLGEALERAADLQLDLNQMDDNLYMLRAELVRAETTVASMAAEISYLKEQKND
jgi:CII-binding regulator of phage lambda lysogenization HflD